jgi:hypothetical protein
MILSTQVIIYKTFAPNDSRLFFLRGLEIFQPIRRRCQHRLLSFAASRGKNCLDFRGRATSGSLTPVLAMNFPGGDGRSEKGGRFDVSAAAPYHGTREVRRTLAGMDHVFPDQAAVCFALYLSAGDRRAVTQDATVRLLPGIASTRHQLHDTYQQPAPAPVGGRAWRPISA